MTTEELSKLCKAHGLTIEEAQQSLRYKWKQPERAKLICYMRDVLLMTFTEISDELDYLDRSGARQAYNLSKKILNNDN